MSSCINSTMLEEDIFMSSLSQSLHALCRRYLKFDFNIVIEGYVQINIDNSRNLCFVLNENVQSQNQTCKPDTKYNNDCSFGYEERTSHIKLDDLNGFMSTDLETEKQYGSSSTNNSTVPRKGSQSFNKNLASNKHNREEIFSDSNNQKETNYLGVSVFPNTKDLKRMLKSPADSSVKQYKCTDCNKVFPYVYKLEKHMKLHNTVEKRHMCSICGARFADHSTLRHHTKTHSSEKPHHCDFCMYRSISKTALRVHLRTHTNERPYKCLVCGKCFRQEGALHCHTRTHTGEKPYKCEVCGTCFAQSCNLKLHSKTHTSERLFTCDICGAKFKYSSSLKIHYKNHSGEKRYKCEICGECFTQSYQLKKHTRVHSGDDKYFCDICGMAFTQKGSVERHVKRKHHKFKMKV